MSGLFSGLSPGPSPELLPAVPEGARPASRVVLLDPRGRILLLRGREGVAGREFWVTPGGGLESTETFQAAAAREVLEETGIEVEPGPYLWWRHHVFEWEGHQNNQFERYFLARTESARPVPRAPDSYIVGYKWWSLRELQHSQEQFAPRRLATLVARILDGGVPDDPFDAGV